MSNPLDEKKPALGVQGGGSTPARGWGESPILGIKLGAEGAGAKLRRTSDGRVYWGVSTPTCERASPHSDVFDVSLFLLADRNVDAEGKGGVSLV